MSKQGKSDRMLKKRSYSYAKDKNGQYAVALAPLYRAVAPALRYRRASFVLASLWPIRTGKRCAFAVLVRSLLTAVEKKVAGDDSQKSPKEGKKRNEVHAVTVTSVRSGRVDGSLGNLRELGHWGHTCLGRVFNSTRYEEKHKRPKSSLKELARKFLQYLLVI